MTGFLQTIPFDVRSKAVSGALAEGYEDTLYIGLPNSRAVHILLTEKGIFQSFSFENEKEEAN